MRTSAPITALAAMTVSAPISARGPITAPGSMVTPLSSRALRVHMRAGALPAGFEKRRRPQRAAETGRAQPRRRRDRARARSARQPPPAAGRQARPWSGRRRHGSWPRRRRSALVEEGEIGRTGAVERANWRCGDACGGARRPRRRSGAAISASVRPRVCRKEYRLAHAVIAVPPSAARIRTSCRR